MLENIIKDVSTAERNLSPHGPDALTELEREAYRFFKQHALPGDRPPSTPGYSARDVAYSVFRHKWLIIGAFLLCSCATYYYVAHVPASYKSEADIMIRGLDTSLTTNPLANGDSFLTENKGIRADPIATEINLIESKAIAEPVVEQVGAARILGIDTGGQKLSDDLRLSQLAGPARPAAGGSRHWLAGLVRRFRVALNLIPPDMTLKQAAMMSLLGNLDAWPIEKSNVIQVGYYGKTPALAREVLDAVLSTYQRERLFLAKNQMSPEFFQKKAQEVKTRLDRKEAELGQLKKQLDIASLDDQKKVLFDQLINLETTQKTVDAQVAALEAKNRYWSALLKQKEAAPDNRRQSTDAPNATISGLRSQLLDLELKEKEMATKYNDQWQPLIALRQQISFLKQHIADEEQALARLPADLNPANQDLAKNLEANAGELDGQKSQAASLSQAIEALRRRINEVLGNESRIVEMERAVNLLDNEYRQYQKSYQIAQVAATLDQTSDSNVSVLSGASLPVFSTKLPRKMISLLVFGNFAGLAAGLALALALDFINRKIKNSREVERKLGLTVLVSLPVIKNIQPVLNEREQDA